MKAVIYLALISVTHLLISLGLFFWRLKNEQLLRIGNVKVLKADKAFGNSSFMNVIFINDDGLEPDEIKQIIAHEMLHVKLMHSADRLVARLVQVILWFDPFAYLYIRSIEENHEFEVDRIAANNDGKGIYATLLFKLAASGQDYLFHGFSKVPIKKRIAMLFNQPTKNMKKIVYVLILPLVVISCLAFANLKKDDTSIKKTAALTVSDSVKVTPITYDADGRAVLSAKTDAAQSVIDEYTSLLKKCSLPYKKGDAINLNPSCSAADRERLKALYIQMSRKQQLQQYVWIRPKDPMPSRFKHNPPTQQQLTEWQKSSPANYFIGMDGYGLKKNDELAKYKPEDFNYASVSIGHDLYKYNNGKPKLYKGTYHLINLETNGYYDKRMKEISAKTEWHVNQFSKEREELVMANW